MCLTEMPPQVTISLEVGFDSFAQFMGNHDAIQVDEQIFEPRHPSNIPRVIELLFYFLRKHVHHIMLLQKSLPIAGESQLSLAGVVKGYFKPSWLTINAEIRKRTNDCIRGILGVLFPFAGMFSGRDVGQKPPSGVVTLGGGGCEKKWKESA